MNMLKRSLAMMLVLCMLFSMATVTAFAEETTDSTDTTIPVVDGNLDDNTNVEETPATEETDADQPSADDPGTGEGDAAATASTEDPYGIDLADLEPKSADFQYRILHLDCGRKYFSVDWIIALINEMSAAGYNQLQLAFGNDGLRFLLNDMSVTVNGMTYSSADVTAGIKAGNKAYNATVSYNPSVNELTEAEMDEIIAHANSKGIQIVPHMNMPGHMDAILDAIEYVDISNAHFTADTTSKTSLNLDNSNAVAFAKALLQRYVDYFADNGCQYFHIGADEYANDAYAGDAMGFPSMGSTRYGRFATFVNDCAAIVKDKGMTPRAWNDGISYPGYTSTFDTDIQVTYWSNGWNGYNPASPGTLHQNGHPMINTHGSYYFILTGNGLTNPSDSALNFSNTSFPGGYISNPVGSMFCIWCDVPGSATEEQVAAAARITLRKMAAAMKGTTSYSEEVISGGFNADGTIAETREWKTVENPDSNVTVSGYELTNVTVTEAETPAIEGAAAVKAWDITPSVNGTPYTERGTVKLPVPADWNTNLIRGFYMENGAAVLVTGSYADGFYTFDMPHFSVGGIMVQDASTVYDQLIELEVGDTHEIVIKNVEYNGEYATNPTGIATVVAEFKAGEGAGETPVTSVAVGESYYLKNDAGQYMKADATFTGDISEAVKWTINVHAWYADGGYYSLSYNGQHLYYDDWSGTGVWETDEVGDAFSFQNGKLVNIFYSNLSFVPVTAGGTVDQSTITFTGVAPGTTFATVGDTTYKIVVHGTVDITIKYQTENGTVIKTETVNVADNATTYTVSNFTHTDGKYYVVDNTTLNITPATVKEYTVLVTETEEDLTTVAPLTIEYWQTNKRVRDPAMDNAQELSVAATDAYSEAGLTLIGRIPSTGYSGTTPVVYWRSRLLANDERQEDGSGASDRTWSGTGFTKVRYWNGTWAVYTDDNVWQDIAPANYQLVAYYMNDMNLADEVKVGTSDWAKKGNQSPDHASEGYVSIVYQVVYEGGTRFPADITTNEVGEYSYLVNAWRNSYSQVQRGVGTIALTQVGDYEIWKVTAETGEHTLTENNTIGSISWDHNERVLFENENNPVSQYTIYNPSQPANVIKDSEHENLYWDEQNESILIRIYVKAVETEDSLKVVYYDEKFGATLLEYNIQVPSGSNFNEDIVVANTENSATLPGFATNPERKDATGYGIVNALHKTQNFETDLANVAVTNNRYNKDLYKYTGSVVSEDGKTITHYYTIDQTALSPNLVVDFGLPVSFPLSDVVDEGIDTVQTVTVNPRTKYGTLSYDSEKQMFTYTPTQILPTIDVLTINILFDGQTAATTTNVGVTPATTVYYEESFINWDSRWSGGNAAITVGEQAKEVLGKNENNFGYDSVYANTTGASNGTNASASAIGAKGTFTFTGDGIQVFANATQETGRVSVMVTNSSGQVVNMSMVDTVVNPGDTGATDGNNGSHYGLPIVSLIDLQNIPHDTYTVSITKIMDSKPVYIDGIRVFNTVEDSSIFEQDLEDNPDFYELRDAVLHALGVAEDASVDYETMYEQVYNAVADAEALITDENVTYGNSEIVQDLLDNGPKNEIYLYAGQTLTFKVKTNRVMQVGLKAPQGATNATIKVNNVEKSQSINSSVDMFYTLANKAEAETTYTVEIKNDGNTILSVTELKICDDPNAAFVPFTVDEIKDMLCGETEEEVPVEPTEPETPTEPSEPSEPETEPTEPTKPGKPDKPGQNKPGKPGKPEKPGKPDQNKPGNGKTQELLDQKTTLEIVFVNLAGKKLDTAIISKTGTENESCVFTLAEIFEQAPDHRYVMWLLPVVVSCGGVETIIVPVI